MSTSPILKSYPLTFSYLIRTNKSQFSISHLMDIPMGAVQNALLQLPSGHLPGAVWHASYQGKILATALPSLLILGKALKRCQWLALPLMGGDISLVEFSKSEEENMDSMANRSEQNIELGLTMDVGACSLLGLCRCVYEGND